MSRPDPRAQAAKLRERLRSMPRPEAPERPEVPRLDPAKKASLVASQQAAAARARARMQARLEALRSGRSKEERRRRPWWLLVVSLLLLLLAIVCCVGPCEPEVVVEEETSGEGEAPQPVEVPTPKPRYEGRMEPRPRPSFPSVAPKPVPWLASFQMQVAARSTRLAGCFEGTTRPGVLRWTALLDPATGRVSDHELEPVLQSDQLTSPQRACVIQVLETPPYRIEDGGEASRVGMVVEF